MKKTIYLNADVFSLEGEVVYRTSLNDDYATIKKVKTKYKIGAEAVLASRTDVSPDALRDGTKAIFYLSFDLDGISGNSDSGIKRTSGWRGTTNDISIDAYGICKIKKIYLKKSGAIAVQVSR